jgi:hypothetical protein
MIIKISLVWAAIVLFVASEGALLYEFHNADDKWKQTIVFGASIVAGAFALFSYLKGIEQGRRQTAERLIDRWTDPSMMPLKDIVREITEGHLDTAQLMRSGKGVKLDQSALCARSKVIGMLNFYEEVAIAVRIKSADEDILQRFFRAVILQAFDNLEVWIRNERTIDNESRYYVELEQLVAKWKTKDG